MGPWEDNSFHKHGRVQCPFKTHAVAFWPHENNEDKFENDG